MSRLPLYLSILILINITADLFGQTTNQWEQLKEAAHDIGLCVFSIQEEYCNEHQKEYLKREQSVNLDEKDVYYFEMKEDWAKERIVVRADYEDKAEGDYLILFDVQQGAFTYKDSVEVNRSMNNFIMVNLNDSFSFSEKKKTEYSFESVLESNRENSILENFLWREYMSGRQGRLMKKTSYAIVSNQDKIKLDKFCERFFSYQDSKK